MTISLGGMTFDDADLANALAKGPGSYQLRCMLDLVIKGEIEPPVVTPPAPQPTGEKLVRQGFQPTNPVTRRIVGSGTTFDVGPGMALTDLDAIPWTNIGTGDVVNIGWRSLPYRTKFGLRAPCKGKAPLIINGVTNSAGDRPELAFDGAVTASGSAGLFGPETAFGESLGGIVIKRGNGDAWEGPKPSNIQIRNLGISGARKGVGYTGLDGMRHVYGFPDGLPPKAMPGPPAGIYVLASEDLTIENCDIRDNTFGFFSMAKDGTLAQTSERPVLRSNRFYRNGLDGSYLEHNCYLQSAYPVVEGNYFGPTASGSQGSCFKDRSAQLIYRFNTMVLGGSARGFDCIDSQDNLQGIAAARGYGIDYVIDNDFDLSGAAPAPFHYGFDTFSEDDGSPATPIALPSTSRKLLYFVNNRVKMFTNVWHAKLFALSAADVMVEAHDNTFDTTGSQQVHLLGQAGSIRLGANGFVGALVGDTDSVRTDRFSIVRNAPRPVDALLLQLLAA